MITARQLVPGDSNRTLGAPIANSHVLILDDDLQPVAEHTVGELFIVGPGVCLGYLNNPQQTAERYLTLDLPGGEQLRAYRSGDMARWGEHGIELCGRRDNQVKIRGFRVEPEEIERCLRESQLYRQVAVVIDSQRRILAFLAQPQTDAARDALKAHAQQFLPDYMQPVAWTELPSMPFASNGKVDRKALLGLPVSVQDNGPKCLPANEDEALLLEIWAELLELPTSDISTDESFFNLGGHSILLSRMLLRLREEFGRSISINRFIEQPTIIKLATLVRGTDDSAVLSVQAMADAERTLDIEPLPISRMGDVHKVIVTGANSFVGVHIVEALLGWGASEVACLVRDGGGQTAAQRFAQALRENRLEHLDLSRVRVYAADITRPQLGLGRTTINGWTVSSVRWCTTRPTSITSLITSRWQRTTSSRFSSYCACAKGAAKRSSILSRHCRLQARSTTRVGCWNCLPRRRHRSTSAMAITCRNGSANASSNGRGRWVYGSICIAPATSVSTA